MKKIAVITMARNDEMFLNKWISYYGSIFGEENLYVYLDGFDQQAPAKAGKANIIKCERIDGNVVGAEKRRLSHLSKMAAEHLKKYDLVIGCDADEFLVVDPALEVGLGEYLSGVRIDYCLSGLGLDVGQDLNAESDIDPLKPYLMQRGKAYLSSRYTKPVIVAKPGLWGSGFHRYKGHNFHIDPNLYLFHFGCFDNAMLEARFSDKDRMAAGWGRHIRKRFRTIRYCTSIKPKGEWALRAARIIQTILRPIYSLNKPSMGCIKWVVNIPERFKNIL